MINLSSKYEQCSCQVNFLCIIFNQRTSQASLYDTPPTLAPAKSKDKSPLIMKEETLRRIAGKNGSLGMECNGFNYGHHHGPLKTYLIQLVNNEEN